MTGNSVPPTATPTPTGSIARPRRRTPFWDNARFACIVFVVLGHAVQRLTYDSDIALGLYLVIYAFHMPAFAIISGYFSTSRTSSRMASVTWRISAVSGGVSTSRLSVGTFSRR